MLPCLDNYVITRNADKRQLDDVLFHEDHARKGQPNRRRHLPDYAAWEIHPVMKIAVNGPSLLCRIGPVAFFMKPFDDEKFIAAVRDALNQSLSRK
jgi:hypothetical protein